MGYTCASCGQPHDERPTAFIVPLPDAVAAVPPEERARRVESSSDQHVLDDEHFFILCNLDLPTTDGEPGVRWSVWSTLSRKNFVRSCELWTTEGRESEPPYFGYLNNEIPGIEGTLNLHVHVHTSPVGVRPQLEVISEEHPLYLWQRDGIDRRQADALIDAAMRRGAG